MPRTRFGRESLTVGIFSGFILLAAAIMTGIEFGWEGWWIGPVSIIVVVAITILIIWIIVRLDSWIERGEK